ncbi:MAG: putative low-complexity protein, partial [Chthonomonadaceae bacterium]|nr:putative low-complexity protein [Chthonomonadaceae bacterium]
ACGVPEAEALRLAEIRLPLMVLTALSDEWRSNAEFYKPLLSADSPFQPAAEREYDWTQYRFHLQAQFTATPLFDEDFALASVYVPLRAYLEIRPQTERTAYVRDTPRIRYVSDLETTVTTWLQYRPATTANYVRASSPGKLLPSTALCILSGGPGSGKSSFCKKLAARLAEEGRQVLLIPMHHFTLKGDIPASVNNYVERLGLMNHAPLQNRRALFPHLTAQPPLILIFDGLDELASQGRASKEAAAAFLSALKDFLRDENAGDNLHVQAIVSSRELVLQTHDTELTGRPILHLLPYFLTPDEITPPAPSSRPYTYNDPNHLLPEDQRETWWKRFTRAKDSMESPMPEALQRDDLREITEQPLLNYLLALSFRRGTVDFASEANRNVIYDDLLHAVYDKRWGGENVHAAGLTFDDFAAVLEETGLAVWHTDGRTAKLPDIQQRCAGLPPEVLEKFAEGAEKGVMRLLTAFYIRKTEAYDAPAFEFTHKSFGEYLTARRLVSGLYDIRETLNPRRGRRPEKPEEKALIEWALLFGPTPIDIALLRFLRNEVARIHKSGTVQNPDGKADIEAFQQMLCNLIGVMLRDGMPMHHTDLKPTTYAEMDRQARNAEEALLVMLNVCACVTEKVSNITWSERNEQNEWTQPFRAGTWLHRLCGQRIEWSPYSPFAWSPYSPLALSCLAWLNLNSCILTCLDLWGADLRGAVLRGAKLEEALLREAKLQGADLHGANLQWADLFGADLRETNLQGAVVQRAGLQGANLQGADLREADLRGADLFGADLRGTNLHRANFHGTKLHAPRCLAFSIGFDEAILDPEHSKLLEEWKRANPKAP